MIEPPTNTGFSADITYLTEYSVYLSMVALKVKTQQQLTNTTTFQKMQKPFTKRNYISQNTTFTENATTFHKTLQHQCKYNDISQKTTTLKKTLYLHIELWKG